MIGFSGRADEPRGLLSGQRERRRNVTLTLTLRSFEYWLIRFRRIWPAAVTTGLLNPILYLGALGIGLGSLVDRSGTRPGDVPYLEFVAPGLLAATAMQVGATEGAWPVMAGIKWIRTYVAMLATPLGIREILLGHHLFMAARVLGTSVIYLAVIAAFGAIRSPLGLLALPAALLVGTAFAAPVSALSATFKSGNEFNPLFRFGIVPMFLFSGTFIPVQRLPGLLEPLAYVVPLWHGVELCRGLTLGSVETVPALGHVAYLLLWTVGGLVVARRTFERALRK